MTNRHTGKVFAFVLIAALAGWVVGCTNTGVSNPQNDVYAVAVALTTADNIAIRYVTLPLCGPTHAKPLCSEAAVSAKIKAAAQRAHDAVKAAEANPGLLSAAQTAVDDLAKTTPQTGGTP